MERLFRGVGRLSKTAVFERGKGSFVWTTSGDKFLDFTAGIGVINTGHCHPRVVKAAQLQCEKILHSQANLGCHSPMLELTQDLVGNALLKFPSLDRIFYSTTGAEAVENAIKLAKSTTGRSSIIVFQGGYHGRTQLTMSLTTSSIIYRKSNMTASQNVYVAPYPYGLHDPVRYSTDSCLSDLKLMLKQQVDPNDVAALIVEPVLGEGGYVPAPPEFFAGLRQICDEHGILLIADEVQTGFGRTGDWFASGRWMGPGDPAGGTPARIEPDVLVMAKGLASGFPLSAVAARASLADRQEPGTMGGTYAGNAVACAAAVATQHVIRDEGLLENATSMGEYLMNSLKQVQNRHPDIIWDVRGVGCMVGVEFYNGGGGAVPVDGTLGKRVSQSCLQLGMLLLPASVFPTVRFIPPLTVTASEIDLGVEIFERAVVRAVEQIL
jgi:4-aminobutyrate aminotransferase